MMEVYYGSLDWWIGPLLWEYTFKVSEIWPSSLILIGYISLSYANLLLFKRMS